MLFMLMQHLWFLLAAAVVGIALGWWAAAPQADDRTDDPADARAHDPGGR